MREAHLFLFRIYKLVYLSNGARGNEQFNLFLEVINSNFIFFSQYKFKDTNSTTLTIYYYNLIRMWVTQR